jgi:DNA-directed RNA polymerase specialized sigma24 family protein
MSSLPQTATKALPTDHELRQRAAIELLTIHAEKKASLRRAERHLVVAARKAGVTLQRIADALDCSITPVREHIIRAQAAGEFDSPMDGSEPPAGE